MSYLLSGSPDYAEVQDPVQNNLFLSAEDLERLISDGSYCRVKFHSMPGNSPYLFGYTDDFDIVFNDAKHCIEWAVRLKEKMEPELMNSILELLDVVSDQSKLSYEEYSDFLSIEEEFYDEIEKLRENPSYWMDNDIKITLSEDIYKNSRYQFDRARWFYLCVGAGRTCMDFHLALEDDRCCITDFKGTYGVYPIQITNMILNKHFRLRLSRFSATRLFLIVMLKVLGRRAKRRMARPTRIFPELLRKIPELPAQMIAIYLEWSFVVKAVGQHGPWYEYCVKLSGDYYRNKYWMFDSTVICRIPQMKIILNPSLEENSKKYLNRNKVVV